MRVGAHVSTAGGVENAPERGADLGAEVIQIFSKNQRQWKAKPLGDDNVAGYREGLKGHGLGPSLIHTSYLLNLASPKDGLWEKSVDALVDELERGEQLGIPWVVFHPGAHTGSGEEAGCDRVTDGLNAVLERTAGLDIIPLIENNAGQGTCVGRSFEEIARMLDGVEEPERVGVCFDTCHAYVAGFPIHTEEGYGETFDQFDEAIGLERLKAFHLNDAKVEFGSNRDRHENLGEGTMGLGVFERLMQDPRFEDHPGYLETPGGDEGYRNDLKILKGFRK